MAKSSGTSSSSGNGSSTAQFSAPQISTPKGGGAIRGIGEKFSANAATGTGSLTIPIAVSPARSGFDPQLSLNYDSGSGNGSFGFGWSQSSPNITRKTAKGMPRYHDRSNDDSRYREAGERDVFLLSGAEDLVPVLGEAHGERDGYRIEGYRPRVESLFARIERWTRLEDGEAHWRTISAGNVLTIYGDSAASRIADPDDAQHVFCWMIAASYDDRGNAIVYEYCPENDSGVDLRAASERSRDRSANRYLKRILYGNREPIRGRGPEVKANWMFEVVFDYGEEGYREEAPDDEGRTTVAEGEQGSRKWTARADPFSSYRSGFEVRTHRLCCRVLMFHRFPEELGTERCLVRSTEFRYREKRIETILSTAIQSGYSRIEGGRYLKKSLPALEMEYSTSPLEEEVEAGPTEWRDARHNNLPVGIDGAGYRWVDLDGEGIPGVLMEQDQGWYYKHNLGQGRFSSMQLVAQKPSLGELEGGHQQLLDVRGAGSLNLVELGPEAPGFYERTRENEWGPFRSFRSFPVLEWDDPNLRFVDVTGDGIADILLTEDAALRWHRSRMAEGFGPGVRIPAPTDEEEGPRVVFADAEDTIYLADMSGDGLSDIVRIRNGEICYWPNRGYGRFGAKITMGNSPRLDDVGQFDAKRVRLADTDGSGTTDVLYLGAKGIRIYLNESGNSWSDVRRLPISIDDATTLSVTDFLGRGTACVVWSSPLASAASRPLRYLDLMQGKKPHLLTRSRNNLGAETAIEYASSTEFYLADQAAGRPWVTRLPFPVHVVTSVTSYDFVSRNRSVSHTTYHHGYFDGVEREFRGFGRVEQMDTESLGVLNRDGEMPDAANKNDAFNVPPVMTKRWFHTGAFLDGNRISRHMAHEYYVEPMESKTTLLDDTVLPNGLSPEETREACRALKGSMLREEVYALDGSEASSRPYTVKENNYTIAMLQRRGGNLHGVFFAHARESVAQSYERKLYDVGGRWRADPRTSHGMTLQVDQYGNTLKSVQIAYGRRFPELSDLLEDEDRRKQTRTLVTLMENRFTNAVRGVETYRNPTLAEANTYELTGIKVEAGIFGALRLLRFEEMIRQVGEASRDGHELAFDDAEGKRLEEGGLYRRVIGRSRQVYRSDDLSRMLPPGELQARALPGESYQMALTADLIARVYRRDGEDLLPDLEGTLREAGGYRHLDGDGQWWVPSGRVFYSPESEGSAAEELAYARRHFFLPHRYRDEFGNTMHVRFDRYDLMPEETRDALDSRVTARTDYRVLAPWQVTDINGNRAEVLFDALGMVAATAVKGKEEEQKGDSLEGVIADLPERTVLAHLGNPFHDPQSILGMATTRLVYDLFAFVRSREEARPQPTVTYTLMRETHVSDLAPGESTKIQHEFSYSDGFGRVAQKKVQAEGDRSVAGSRWAGTGWTIFDNKGNPVRTYEPFFSETQSFEYARGVGVSATLFYDPLGRVIATLHPEHTYEKTMFDPWRQEVWDVNDTVLEHDPASDRDVGGFFARLPKEDYLPTWYEQRRQGALGSEAEKAARKSSVHARTPKIAILDSLGQSFLAIEENRFEREGAAVTEFLATRSELDIQGHPRWITDALGRRICTYDYDLNGSVLHQASLDSGERWTLQEAAGKPMLSWDSRGQRLRYEYDSLRRQLDYFVQAAPGESERLAERNIYGEGQTDDRERNLRGNIWRNLDGAGVVENVVFDFKGNLVEGTRQLLREYKAAVDWSGQPEMEEQEFRSRSAFDAMNRPVRMDIPDGSVLRPGYNEANLLDTVDVSVRGAETQTRFVRGIRYNAKGQRERVDYGNGARTTYAYDPLTFRLVHLETTREADGATLQDLLYTYDPVGNLSAIRDHAQTTAYFDNEVIRGGNDYVYDAIYRLIGAKGREHIGLMREPEPGVRDAADVVLWRRPQPLPSDGNAMRRYKETYGYDAVGNLLEMVHTASAERWRRRYAYEQSTDRLERTTVGDVEERYPTDPNGNITRMMHLMEMQWDFKNQLHTTQKRVVNEGSGEKTYYIYNSGGQRVRKITDRSCGTKSKERIYLGGFEIYREYKDDEVALERETMHVMDDVHRIALVETKTVDKESSPGRLPSTLMRYQFGNHLDSACLELDEEAAILSYEEFYPYGGTSFEAVRKGVEISPKRYRYIGQERDEETGLYYMGARYYAPWLGRWTSADPKGMVDGTNVFAYCRGNPIALRDPNGTDAESSTAEIEAQACLVDPSLPPPTALEEEEQKTIVSEHVPASFIGPPAPSTAAAPQAPSGPSAQRGQLISPPPPVDPPDNSLYVDHGILWQEYSKGVDEAMNSDNPWWARGILGGLSILAAPVSGAEEYIGRPLANIPWVLDNAGTSIGQHIGRAILWSRQGESGEATVDALEAVVAFAGGFDTAASSALPLTALETSVVRAPLTTASRPLQTAAEEETVSVYHGSIKGGPEILENGLNPARTPTFVSRDFAAAQDALTNHFDAVPGQGTIIESRIPASQFQSTLAPLERPYTGFYPYELQSTEILLRTPEHFELFNQYICK